MKKNWSEFSEWWQNLETEIENGLPKIFATCFKFVAIAVFVTGAFSFLDWLLHPVFSRVLAFCITFHENQNAIIQTFLFFVICVFAFLVFLKR